MSTYWNAQIQKPNGERVTVYSVGPNPIPSNYVFEYPDHDGTIVRGVFSELWEGLLAPPEGGIEIGRSWNSYHSDT